jgi:hypothetical protein
MPVIAGQGIRHITAGYDVQVIDHEPGKVLIRWRGNDYWVTREALDSMARETYSTC